MGADFVKAAVLGDSAILTDVEVITDVDEASLQVVVLQLLGGGSLGTHAWRSNG